MPEPKDQISNTATDMTVAIVILAAVAAFFGVYIEDIARLYSRFLEGFYSLEWARFKSAAFVIFAILDFILLAFLVFVLRKYSKLGRLAPREETSVGAPIRAVPLAKEVSENWERIKKLAGSSNPSGWNMALIRADALLDDILMHLGYEGENLSERLKVVDPAKLKSMDKIWSAHRLRNQIAHDPLVEHTKESIIHTLRSYQEAFKELGVL